MSSRRSELGLVDIDRIAREILPFAEAISSCAGGKLSERGLPKRHVWRARVFLTIPPLWESGKN